MDNAQVTQRDREAAADLYLALDGGSVAPSDIAYANTVRQGRCDDSAAVQAFARHRLERSEPVGCQYPVHGSVTHVRNVECCDFCGHPADTTPPEPVAEIERLREALRHLSDERTLQTAIPEGPWTPEMVAEFQSKEVGHMRDLARAALGDAA